MPPKNTLFIKPTRTGAIVRFPDDPQRTLAENGEEVPRTPYWFRRIAEGSVVEVKKTKTKKEA